MLKFEKRMAIGRPAAVVNLRHFSLMAPDATSHHHVTMLSNSWNNIFASEKAPSDGRPQNAAFNGAPVATRHPDVGKSLEEARGSSALPRRTFDPLLNVQRRESTAAHD